MCSFLLSNLEITLDLLKKINYYLQKRGPDETNVIKIKNFIFMHNLLHITGTKTLQPFYKNNIVCLFNGEIYNYLDFGKYNSDGECLIDLYEKYGSNFIKKLDGEFAIVLIDFSENKLIFSKDIFGTKPLFFSINDNNITLSSYRSGLIGLNISNKEIREAVPNKIYTYDFSTKILNKVILHEFDFISQNKTSYDDWCNKFLESVRKRIQNKDYKKFICLSSGYDSGAICCAANVLNEQYKTFTINARENLNCIELRKKINNTKSEQFNLNKANFIKEYNNLIRILEPEKYPKQIYGENAYIWKDKASVGLSVICGKAKMDNFRIFLSGQGADEIYADYGYEGRDKGSGHSCFGGLWPKNMMLVQSNKKFVSNDSEEDVIWKSFFDYPQKQFIMKEDFVSGAHGIEGRFPFLDKYLVQEFLWLAPELKNKNYKAPLEYFLTKYNYPYDKNIKIGFKADYEFNKNL